MTIYSMTAFSRQGDHHASGHWSWEIRSVNHRYLELQFKLPEQFRHLEMPLRSKLKQTLKRGKIDIILQVKMDTQDNTWVINETAVRSLIAAMNQVQQLCQTQLELQAPRATELLAWPGVLSNEAATETPLPDDALLASFDSALDHLRAERQREGQALVKTLEERLPEVRKIAEALRTHAPAMIENQRQRLRLRIQELESNAQPDRIEQELAIYAQRIDIDEEIDRLLTHTQEAENILATGGHVGRRLDFLMQELNREANTVGSKSAQIDTGQSAIELKVLIEQMREQVQNIE